MNYNDFSERIKVKYPQYKDMDNRELAQKFIEKYPTYKEQVTFDEIEMPQENKGIDLTPSGIYKQAISYPAAALRTAVKGGDFGQNRDLVLDTYENFKPANGLGDFALDLGVYSQLPILRGGGVARSVGNAAIQGGIPMTLEGLKAGNNPISSFGQGTGIGLGIQGAIAGLPYVGRAVPFLGKQIAQKIGHLSPDTLERAVQPDSVALDLTNETADQLALDTTERVRDAYNTLKTQKGQVIADEAAKLSQMDDAIYQTPVQEVRNDITQLFDEGSYGRINPLRDLEGKTEAELNDILNKVEGDTLTPEELLGLKREIGDMTNWDIADARNKNRILERLYGKINQRLNNLSPSLEAANKDYAQLYDMLGEKSRLRSVLNPKADIETATSKLKNYKSTNQNIYDLENQLVNELGEQPFLSAIDDVNAAKELLNSANTGINVLGVSDLAKLAVNPVLRTARWANRVGIPEKINNVKEVLTPFAQRLLTPLAVKGTAPLLYGGVSYDEY